MKSLSSWRPIAGAIIACWIVPGSIIWLSHNENDAKNIPAIATLGLGLLAALHAFGRSRSWSVVVWMPLLAISLIGTLYAAGSLLEQPSSGPSAAPLEGVATSIGVGVALLLGLLGFACLIWRPTTFSKSFTTVAFVNTVLILLVVPNGIRYQTGQVIILRVIDRDKRPVVGASVIFERYGSGPGRNINLDHRGGPILTDEQGVAVIPSRRMRYETRATISKAGFRDLTLSIGMQFNASDKHRSFVLSTYDTRTLAHGEVPATDPVRATIYLASIAAAPDPAVKRIGLFSKRDVGDQIPLFLSLENGKFSTDQPADLKLELSAALNGTRWEPQLRITGLNGTELYQAAKGISLSEPISSFEQVYRIAPETGYQSEILALRPGDYPGPIIYIRSNEGKYYCRLHLQALGNGRDLSARYSGELFINPTGDRRLE